MKTLAQLIKSIEDFARDNGTTPDSVCRSATGNPRLFGRLQNRLNQTIADEKRIRRFMADATRSQEKPAPKGTTGQHIEGIIPPKVQS